MSINFQKNTFKNRLKSMLSFDLRRMFTSPLYYIMVSISLVIPILILVMTTALGSSTPNQTDPTTAIEGFKNVWQIIGTVSTNSNSMSMDLTSMCNINMMFFLIAIFVCIFVSDDFRSGYSKNIFTVRANKADYIISKIIVSFIAGVSMLLAFFIGAMLGGTIAGLPFALEGVSAYNIIMSLLSKLFLVAIFVSIYLLASVIAKQRLWLSLLISFGIGMLFFTMIPIITPLNSGIINFILCLVGSFIFSGGIGIGSYFILKKTSLI